MATISQVKDLNGNLHDFNAATVSGHTVASNVPANAVFTDTTYALVGAQNTTGLIKNGSAVSDVSEMTPCPIVGGVPYYSGGSGSTGLLHVSVPMSDWTGDDTNGWSQTVAAVGVTADADCNPKIDIEHVANTSKADWEAQCEAYSTFTTTGWAETGADTITLNCSERPGADFNILISYGGGIDVMQVTTETGTVVQENVNSPTTVPSSAVVYDLKADSDDQISAINESIAVIESSSTASQSYSVGQQFVYNGLLYEATSAIASGGTITPGSNCARTTVAEELSALNDSLQTHTRKNITSSLSNLKTAIASGNPENYGYHEGDYFTGASGYTYILASYNHWYGGYNNEAVTSTKHWAVLVKTGLTNAWNTSGKTDGGYVASDLHVLLTGTVLTKVTSDMTTLGLSLLANNRLYSTAVNSARYNRYGQASGAASNWSWSKSQKISAPTEVEIYGSISWSSSGFDTGEGCRQLKACQLFRFNELFGNIWFWLRSITSAAYAASANALGYATDRGVASAGGVVGLIGIY